MTQATTPPPSSLERAIELDTVRDVMLLETQEQMRAEPIPRRDGEPAPRGVLEARLRACRVHEDWEGERDAALELSRQHFELVLDIDLAVQLLHRALEILDDRELRAHLARQLATMGRHIEAGHVLRDGEPQTQEEVFVAWLASGAAYARAGDSDEAVATFREAAMVAPEDPAAYERIAAMAYWAPDLVGGERAADAWLEAARRYPTGTDPHWLSTLRAFEVAPSYARSAEAYTRMLRRAGRVDEADEVWRQYGLASGHVVDVAIRRAEIAIAAEAWQAAFAAVLEASAAAADRPDLETVLAELVGHEGLRGWLASHAIDDEAGLDTLLAAARNEGDRATTLEALAPRFLGPARGIVLALAAEGFAQAGDIEHACSAALSAAAAAPTTTRVQATVMALGAHEAIPRAALEHALAHLPARSADHRLLAERCDFEGAPRMALIWNRRVIALRPCELGPLEALLDRAVGTGDAASMSEAVALTVTIERPWRELAPALGRALRAMAARDLELALDAAHRVLHAIGPGDEALLATILRIAEDGGDVMLGLAALLGRAVGDEIGDEDRAAVYLEAAEACVTTGDGEAAAVHVSRAAALGGDLRRIGAAIERIEELLERLPPAVISDTQLALARARAWASEQQDARTAVEAWRTLGALRWDLADDATGADEAFFVACTIEPDQGAYRYAQDLKDRAGANQAFPMIVERAVQVEQDSGDAKLSARLYAAAARIAADAGMRELALDAAVASVRADASRGDAVAIVEKMAGDDEQGLAALNFVYDTLADAALGRYGFRAAHYRAARQLEKLRAYDDALRHAILAFEAVPSVGASYQMLLRLAERANNEDAAVSTLAAVAASFPVEGQIAWLVRASELAKRSAIGAELRLELLLKAFALRQSIEVVEMLEEAASELGARGDLDASLLSERLERAIFSGLAKLDNPRDAPVAIALAVMAARTLEKPDLAVETLRRAMELDGHDTDYDPFIPCIDRVTVDRDAAQRLLEEINELRADSSRPIAKGLKEITSQLYLALSDVPPPPRSASGSTPRPAISSSAGAGSPLPAGSDRPTSSAAPPSVSGPRPVDDAPALTDEAVEALDEDARASEPPLSAVVSEPPIPISESDLLPSHAPLSGPESDSLASDAPAPLEVVAEAEVHELAADASTASIETRVEAQAEGETAVEAEAAAERAEAPETAVEAETEGEAAAPEAETETETAEVDADAAVEESEAERDDEPADLAVAEGADAASAEIEPTVTSERFDEGGFAVWAANLPTEEPSVAVREDEGWDTAVTQIPPRIPADEAVTHRPPEGAVAPVIPRTPPPPQVEGAIDPGILDGLEGSGPPVDSGTGAAEATELQPEDEPTAPFRMADRGDAIDYSPASEALARERGDHAAIAQMLEARARDTDNLEQRRLIRLRRAAVLEQRLDRLDEACVELEKILDENGEDPTALRYLADLCDRQRRHARAAKLWLRASQQATDLEERLRDVVRCCESLIAADRPETAKKLIDAARGLPQSARMLELRIAVAEKLGDEEALELATAELAALDGDEPVPSSRVVETTDEVAPVPLRRRRHMIRGPRGRRDSERVASSRRVFRVTGAPPPMDADADRSPAEVLEACRRQFVERGAGSPREAKRMIRRLRSVMSDLEPEDRDLHTYLLVECLDAAQGTGAAMHALQQHWESHGGTPLVTLAVADRLVRRNDLRPALQLYRRSIDRDLWGVRSNGAVALQAAEIAHQLGDDEAAKLYLRIAGGDPEVLPAAELRYTTWFPGAERFQPSNEPPRPLRTARSAPPQRPRSSLPATRGPSSTPTDRPPSAVPDRSGWPRESDPPPSDPGPSSDPSVETRLEALSLDDEGGVRERARAAARIPSLPPASPAFSFARPPTFPELTSADEESLFNELIDGSYEAGDALAATYEQEGGRTHDVLAVRRYQAILRRGDRGTLAKLREAALRDNATAFARAVEHVSGAFDPEREPVSAPPLNQLSAQPEATSSLLFGALNGTVNEALAVVWESGMMRRELADYDFSGADRVPPVATTPVGRIYAALGRLIDLRGARLFHRTRSAGRLRSRVALVSPLAAIVSGTAERETPVLRYVLGSALAAATPPLAFVEGLDEKDGRTLVRALRAGFGPVDDGSVAEASPEQMRIAEDLWHMVASAGDRRIRTICENHLAVTYEVALSNARRARRRAGLFACGDLVTAIMQTIQELALPVPRPIRSAEALRELCSHPEIADLYDLAIVPEFAEVRWRTA